MVYIIRGYSLLALGSLLMSRGLYQIGYYYVSIFVQSYVRTSKIKLLRPLLIDYWEISRDYWKISESLKI